VTAVLLEPGHADVIEQAQLQVKTIEQHGLEAALTAPNAASSGDTSNATLLASYTAELHITPMPRALCGTTPKVYKSAQRITKHLSSGDTSRIAFCAQMWHLKHSLTATSGCYTYASSLGQDLGGI
jgi:hypothetical protein